MAGLPARRLAIKKRVCTFRRMILTEIPTDKLDDALALYARRLAPASLAYRVFERIAASRHHRNGDADLWHRDAVALADRFGMAPLAEPPEAAYSWDGARVRVLTEPAVLLHEVAHYQLASPERRGLPDFGLGAGPETGRIDSANQACRLTGLPREIEEQMASLLGILWEVELEQPAILAFLEQNWLEGAGRPGAAEFLAQTLARLTAMGLVDGGGRPVTALRVSPDTDTQM
jgi:hypothetical protein